MILVVLGHALIGALNAGFEDRALRALLLVIYSSHMALFFTVSGLLSGGMARRSWPQFAQAMGARILWPYALWSVVLLAAHYVMSGHTNAPLEVFQPWTILWAPPAIMWFLYVLFVALVMMRVLAPAGAGVMALAGLGLMVLAYAVPEVPPNLRFAGLFLIAAAIGPGAWARVRPVWTGLACAVMAGTLWLAIKDSVAPITGYPAAGLAYVPALVAGPLTLLAVARGLGRTGLGPLLAYVGQRTMPIFVTHILITAGLRIVARAAGIDDWWLIIALATVLGVALPLIALALTDRARLSPWLGWR
jgi:fucose 4-O-acetylase-like acetyltransferase